MTPFFLTLGLLVFAWIVHVVWWRISLPQHQSRALLLIFGAVAAIAAACYAWRGTPGVSGFDLPGMALFYAAAAGCYLLVYTGVEESSPSITIFRALEQAGALGLDEAELATHITNERFVKPRLQALQRDGMIAMTEAGGRLTARGRRMALLARRLAMLFNIHRGA